MRTLSSFLLASTVLLAACGGDDASAPDVETNAAGTATPPASAGVLPARTGTVHTIEMIMDDSGNYFKPAEVTAKPGDVLKYVLVSGVHNVHFVADSNPGVVGLPPAGPMLQLPGQTDEVVVPDAVGKRLFVWCDPHALLGMIGHINVVAP
jgi:plastocyanin